MGQPLPPKEQGFDEALENIHRVGGKPLFRCVDGQTETHWFNGNPRDIKHWENDAKKGRVGRECWVIEVFQSPSELDRADWESHRHQYLERSGVTRLVDWRGPFPEKGRYIWFMNLWDENRRPFAPTLKLALEIRKSFIDYKSSYKKSIREELTDYYAGVEQENEDRARRYAENFAQAHGLAALSTFYNVEVGRPITTVKGEKNADSSSTELHSGKPESSAEGTGRAE